MQSIQSSILEQMILFNQLVTSICLNFFFFSNKEYKFERFFGEIESYSKWNCFKNLILRMYYFFPVSMHFSFYRIIILTTRFDDLLDGILGIEPGTSQAAIFFFFHFLYSLVKLPILTPNLINFFRRSQSMARNIYFLTENTLEILC